MMTSIKTALHVINRHKLIWLGLSLSFVFAYYTLLLLFTMARFQEIPNYLVLHDVFEVYRLIWLGTPSLSDALPIMLDEPWLETGYKNPQYYGVATWSYMLIPPKMLLVGLMGCLLSTVIVLMMDIRRAGCAIKTSDSRTNRRAVLAAGFGTSMLSLTSATLTWVVCCATPSWSVALAMLGMSASLALWLEPFGRVLTVLGIVLLIAAIAYQTKHLARINVTYLRST